MDGGGVEGAENGDGVSLGTVGSSASSSGVEEGVNLVSFGNGHKVIEELTGEVTEVDNVES